MASDVEHQTLVKGANAPLSVRTGDDDGRVHAVIGWSEATVAADVDVVALLLGDDGRVRKDEDFVFYNAPAGADGAVRLLGKRSAEEHAEDRVVVDLASLPGDVPRVLIGASLDAADGIGFGDVGGLSVEIRDIGGLPRLRFDVPELGAETALVLGELYLRGDEWKFRAVGQGWDSGLAGLATDYGIRIEESVDVVEASGGLVADDGDDGGGGDEGVRVASEDAVDGDPTDDELLEIDGESSEDIGAGELAPSVDPADLPAADLPATELSAPRTATASPRSQRRGVRTRKKRVTAASLPPLALAGDPSWQPARLFSTTGVGNAEEKERRATSALLSTMMAVREFGRALVARFGGPAGSVEAFLEVTFKLDDRSVIPDGVIRVARAGRVWTALLEVKTGESALRNDQIERYLDLARQQGYDAVVTLSNDIAPVGDLHPVQVDGRKLRRVSLHHISWAEVMHEAQMQLTHRGMGDRLQAWVLAELVRYLRHPSSGAAGFDDMGAAWVPVRDAVAANTLRRTDQKIASVTTSWEKLIRHVCLTMTSTLGVAVTPVQARKLARDHAARAHAAATELAGDGTLSAVIRVPGAAGSINVVADLRTTQVRTSILIEAPRDGGALRRVNWIVRQLAEAQETLTVEAIFTRREHTSCELLRDVRADPASLVPNAAAEIRAFRLSATTSMGPKRSGVRKAFVPSVKDAVEAFYARVVQGLKPSPPRLPNDVAADAIIAVDSTSGTTQQEGTPSAES